MCWATSLSSLLTVEPTLRLFLSSGLCPSHKSLRMGSIRFNNTCYQWIMVAIRENQCRSSSDKSSDSLTRLSCCGCSFSWYTSSPSKSGADIIFIVWTNEEDISFKNGQLHQLNYFGRRMAVIYSSDHPRIKVGLPSEDGQILTIVAHSEPIKSQKHRCLGLLVEFTHTFYQVVPRILKDVCILTNDFTDDVYLRLKI